MSSPEFPELGAAAPGGSSAYAPMELLYEANEAAYLDDRATEEAGSVVAACARQVKSRVSNARFVWMKETAVSSYERPYIVAPGDTYKTILAKNPGVKAEELQKQAPVLKPGMWLMLRIHKQVKQVSFSVARKAVVGDFIYILVETDQMPGSEIILEVRASRDCTLASVGQALPVLCNGSETSSIRFRVGAWAEKHQATYCNAGAYKNSAIIEVQLRPQHREAERCWRRQIRSSADRKAYLHVQLKSSSCYELIYNAEDPVLPAQNHREGVFMNREGKRLELYPCYCGQDLSAVLLQKIGVNKQKSYDYLEALNKALCDYQISSCLRKGHFLAQVIHESQRFRTVREGGVSETAYGGYPGRGLIQLTLEDNYRRYGASQGEDFTSSLEHKRKLEQLPHAVRSAGWYWTSEKNLNADADRNDFYYITRIINGGLNGLDERYEFLELVYEYILEGCIHVPDSGIRYRFELSRLFNEQKGSFAWGLWHNPGLNKIGCSKDRLKAIAGYERFIELAGAKSSACNWYLIDDMAEFADLADKKGRVSVLSVANRRLKALKSGS